MVFVWLFIPFGNICNLDRALSQQEQSLTMLTKICCRWLQGFVLFLYLIFSLCTYATASRVLCWVKPWQYQYTTGELFNLQVVVIQIYAALDNQQNVPYQVRLLSVRGYFIASWDAINYLLHLGTRLIVCCVLGRNKLFVLCWATMKQNCFCSWLFHLLWYLQNKWKTRT